MIRITILVFLVAASDFLYGQCQLDSVQFEMYSFLNSRPYEFYSTADSMMQFLKPYARCTDHYEDGRIVKRVFDKEMYGRYETHFVYQDSLLVEVYNIGRKKLSIKFSYSDGAIRRMEKNSLFTRAWTIKEVDGGYSITPSDADERPFTVITDMIPFENRQVFGNIDFLSRELSPTISVQTTNSDGLPIFDDHEHKERQYEFDDCGNLTYYTEKFKDSNMIEVLLFQYYYSN